MKTKTLLVAVITALALVMPTLSRAQGVVNFTSISQSDYNNYLNNAAWVATIDTKNDVIQIGGNSTSLPFSATLSISILLTESGGTIQFSSLLGPGAPGVEGLTTNVSLSSLAPIGGLVFGMSSPLQSFGSQYTMTAGNILVSGQASPIGLDTSTTPFSGASGIFSSQTGSFNVSATLSDLVGGSRSQFTIIGLTANPVPEPSTMALASLGGLGLLALIRRKK